MSNSTVFNSLLVPVDFSEAADGALKWAAGVVAGEEPTIVVLHVIDESLVSMLVENGFGSREEVEVRLREHAERELEQCLADARPDLQIDRIACVGTPFLEIIRKASDFAVDAIIMSGVGAGGGVEHLLFGSTAEKVLRGSKRPVVVLPNGANV
jgi:nucleotide-binding universal stress UspA family protein